LRNDSHPSGHQEIEHPFSACAEPARNFVPAQAFRQRSFSSDDWQKASPARASAPNGKMFTFGETFDPERDFPATHIKQDVRYPGKQKSSFEKPNLARFANEYYTLQIMNVGTIAYTTLQNKLHLELRTRHQPVSLRRPQSKAFHMTVKMRMRMTPGMLKWSCHRRATCLQAIRNAS
jgi:hypothetical protein